MFAPLRKLIGHEFTGNSTKTNNEQRCVSRCYTHPTNWSNHFVYESRPSSLGRTNTKIDRHPGGSRWIVVGDDLNLAQIVARIELQAVAQEAELGGSLTLGGLYVQPGDRLLDRPASVWVG